MSEAVRRKLKVAMQENTRLRASSFMTAVSDEAHEKLKSEVEQLNSKADQSEAENARSRNQYNGIIDTQMKVIDELKAEVERLKSITDHLPAATKMIWQPIATAPKDGTLILGFFDETICTIEWFIYDGGRGQWETFYGESEVVPTHWMPLPAPPNQTS